MPQPPLQSLNLNSLVALDALLAERNVTRAARRVGITQPAMSQALGRLRSLFDDPLLARQGRGMVLTPRARTLREPLAAALLAVERVVHLGMGFDPETSERVFRVALTDLTSALILPRLLAQLSQFAPGVRLEALPLWGPNLAERLLSGRIDVALSVHVSEGAGLESEILFEDHFVCLLREGHPLAGRSRLKLGDYPDWNHVAYTPLGFVPSSMSGALPGLNAVSALQASVPYFLAIPELVRRTDLIATVPASLMRAPVDTGDLVCLDAPPELPRLRLSQWWNRRVTGDPAHVWFRELMRANTAFLRREVRA